MIAIFGGLGAASVFATATLSASRGTRLIGPRSFLAGVMLVGLVVTLPAVAALNVPHIGGADAGWLLLSGGGNVAGLLCAYAALRLGKVGIVAPIVSTEGAIAAVFAVVAGEGISPGAGATLGVIACGILLSGVTRDVDEVRGDPRGLRASVFAVAAALALFTIGSRHGIAVSAVLASQFAAIAAVAAYLLFGERLARVQLAGVASIVVGVGVLTALQA